MKFHVPSLKEISLSRFSLKVKVPSFLKEISTELLPFFKAQSPITLAFHVLREIRGSSGLFTIGEYEESDNSD